jgi:hypothetical protein
LLKNNFITVAIDQAYQRRSKDDEGEFYRKIITANGREIKGTTQGLYVGTADGQLLGSTNNRSPERVLAMLKKSLKDYKPKKVKALTSTKSKDRWNPNLKYPVGGFCARVNGRVLGGYEKTDNKWQALVQQAISRDNLWATKSEHEAIQKGTIPESLQKRIARFHLVDNTRGEPPMWKEDEIISLEMKLNNHKISGSVSLKSNDGSRSYKANIRGVVAFYKNGKLAKFDLVTHGMFSGEGRYTKGAPKGSFPFAVSITLADGSDIADEIPPQGSRGWVPGYIKQ